MESDRKKQFTVQIRRKNVQNKLQALRSMYFAQQSTSIANEEQLLSQLLKGQLSIKQKLFELKIISYKKEHIKTIMEAGIVQKLFQLILEDTLTDIQYNDIMNIMINICGYSVVQIQGKVLEKVVSNFLKQNRQIFSEWLIANIIYQTTSFSKKVANQLISVCQLMDFLESRVSKKFQKDEDIVIFNFFCCSFLTVSDVISDANFPRLLKTIEVLLKYKPLYEQNLWYLSQALPDHGLYIGQNGYQILRSQIMQQFYELSKKKKTKYVKNYLKMLTNFTQTDKNAYQKFKKYQIFSSLNYCLENRFPEIRKLCAQIGLALFHQNRKKIDIQNIYFFQQLSTQFINYQKYDLPSQICFLKFSAFFYLQFCQTLNSGYTKNQFLQGIVANKGVGSLCLLIKTCNGNSELIVNALKILYIFIDMDYEYKIMPTVKSNDLITYLTITYFQNDDVSKSVQNFLVLAQKKK